MKKLLFIAMLLMLSVTGYAQQDVTQFLGIPVDGTKEEMIQKLKSKGFRNSQTEGVLKGEFNGEEVEIHVVTDNNRVWRLMIDDVNTRSEAQIRLRFNTLCRQFENNKKYMSFSDDQTIAEDVDISYEMTVHDKQYQAVFYQQPTAEMDSVALSKILMREMSKYSSEYITEDVQNEITAKVILECLAQKSVWFTIHEFRGEYYISMYYDNEYNHSNGEDL